jgi:hypothetical protein
MVIALISLAYVEEDGLLLSVALLAAIALIGIAPAAVWGTVMARSLLAASGSQVCLRALPKARPKFLLRSGCDLACQ